MPIAPQTIERAGHALARVFVAAGSVLLAMMLALTLVDVFGRYILNAPVNGKTELTRFLMAGLICCALPVITTRGEHIAVDLFDKYFSQRGAAIRDFFVDTVVTVTFFVLADWLFFRSARLLKHGNVSDFLGIPLYPVAYFVSVIFVVCGIAMAVKLVLDLVYVAHPDLRHQSITQRTFDA